ncbi:MAG: hypothetical protein IKU15_05860 [Clostridia bacterium]|nr:hypothetical protein [Clostridia bacterium]
MESGMLLNGNGHFAVHDVRGRITCIDIYNGLFSPESEIGEVNLYVKSHTYMDGEGDEYSVDFKMCLFKKAGGYCSIYLQKNKSEVLRKFLDYIDENKHQILQCDYEHGCSLSITDVDFI